jgi:hypothetical protein
MRRDLDEYLSRALRNSYLCSLSCIAKYTTHSHQIYSSASSCLLLSQVSRLHSSLPPCRRRTPKSCIDHEKAAIQNSYWSIMLSRQPIAPSTIRVEYSRRPIKKTTQVIFSPKRLAVNLVSARGLRGPPDAAENSRELLRLDSLLVRSRSVKHQKHAHGSTSIASPSTPPSPIVSICRQIIRWARLSSLRAFDLFPFARPVRLRRSRVVSPYRQHVRRRTAVDASQGA